MPRHSGKKEPAPVKVADAPVPRSVKDEPSLLSMEDDEEEKAEKLLDAIADALEKTDPKALLAVLEDIRKSEDPEVRLEAVEALVWFGADYLSEIMSFVEDPDPEVREAARDGCDVFVSEIEDEGLRARTINAFAAHLTDFELLESVLAQLEGVKESTACDAIYDVIVNGTYQAREAAKKEYEKLTGEEFTSLVDIRKHQHEVRKEEAEEDL